jgi:uncharacterized protein
MEKLIDRITEIAKSVFELGENSIHGIHHWKQVEHNGIMLATLDPRVDLLIVRLFAYLHDCKRVDENFDEFHGIRAGEFVQNLRINDQLNDLSYLQFIVLKEACDIHNTGATSENPTIGACLDADRIELLRVGIVPHPDLMNTQMGKRIASKLQIAHNIGIGY